MCVHTYIHGGKEKVKRKKEIALGRRREEGEREKERREKGSN